MNEENQSQIQRLRITIPRTEHRNIHPPPSTPTPALLLPPAYSVMPPFIKHGYMPFKKICTTLQGSIWIVFTNHNCSIKGKSIKCIPIKVQTIVFGFINLNQILIPTDLTNLILLYYWKGESQIAKVANKSLHKKSIAYIDEISVPIKENVVKETAILRYLSENKSHKSLIQYKNSFCDPYNYFLVMEHGGRSFFHFIKTCHELIKEKSIDISEWHCFCKEATKQMVDVLAWLHNDMNCCHLDVSLENFVIKNVESTIIMRGNAQKIKFSNDFKVKIIDFGLAEVFTARKANGCIDFRCNKYVGKKQYKAPKVYGKRHIFDASSADCWSLGVCYFMLFLGVGPWKKPSKSDALFRYIMNGRLIEVLDSWDLLHYISDEIFDLLSRIFRLEQYRLTMKGIQNHCWFHTKLSE